MKTFVVVFAVVLLLAGILYYLKYSRIARFRNRYAQLTHQSPQVAQESLQLQLEKLKVRTPGKTEKWYLEKIIFDLERDMR